MTRRCWYSKFAIFLRNRNGGFLATAMEASIFSRPVASMSLSWLLVALAGGYRKRVFRTPYFKVRLLFFLSEIGVAGPKWLALGFEVVTTMLADSFGNTHYRSFTAIAQPLLTGAYFDGEASLQSTLPVLYETLIAFSHFTYDYSDKETVMDSFQGMPSVISSCQLHLFIRNSRFYQK